MYVHRKDDCKITDDHLAFGAAPDKMNKDDCELWLKEIRGGNFSVRLQSNSDEGRDEDDQAEIGNNNRGDEIGDDNDQQEDSDSSDDSDDSDDSDEDD